MKLKPGHLPEEQQKILRAVALAYRRVMRAPQEPAATRAEGARLAQKRQSEALAAATAEYRRLSPSATGDQRAVSGEVNRMIAAAINVDPRCFWRGRMCSPCSESGRAGTRAREAPARPTELQGAAPFQLRQRSIDRPRLFPVAGRGYLPH
jgi:hypothetical protein